MQLEIKDPILLVSPVDEQNGSVDIHILPPEHWGYTNFVSLLYMLAQSISNVFDVSLEKTLDSLQAAREEDNGSLERLK